MKHKTIRDLDGWMFSPLIDFNDGFKKYKFDWFYALLLGGSNLKRNKIYRVEVFNPDDDTPLGSRSYVCVLPDSSVLLASTMNFGIERDIIELIESGAPVDVIMTYIEL